jgi:hypothetical protein
MAEEKQNSNEEITDLIQVLSSKGYKVSGYRTINDYPIEKIILELQRIVV